jgi:ABC-type sugar transport system ATPase subunit
VSGAEEPAVPILALRGLSKRYGAVEALQAVDLAVARGETVAICGDNGAGKSTLIRIISGAQPPSDGEIRLKGRVVRFASPADAFAQGVATIYQDLALAPRMAIYQNIFMGSELMRPSLLPGLKLLDKPAMRRAATTYLGRLKIALDDMDKPVEALSGGQRQAVAIARALRWQADIVILDEPTAALGVRETRQVLDLIHEIKSQGITVLLISHNMRDVVEVADRAVILKAGRKVAEVVTAGLGAESLASLVMGDG